MFSFDGNGNAGGSNGHRSRGSGSRGRANSRARGSRGRPVWFRPRSVPELNESDIDYSFTERSQNVPFKGWHLYFGDQEAKIDVTHKITHIRQFLERNIASIDLESLEDKRYYNLDLKKMLEDTLFLEQWRDFMQDLTDNPSQTLSCIGLALHTVATNVMSDDFELPYIRIRLLNYQPLIPLKDIKSALFGKLISVRGTVIRVGPARLICTRMGFACTTCKRPQAIYLSEGVYQAPKSCPLDECKSKTFMPLHSSHLTQTKNFQVIKLQESIDDSDLKSDGGRVPRNVEVELIDDLTDTCCPGDNVIITGIVKVNNQEEGRKKNSPNLFTLYLEGVSIINSKGSGGRITQSNAEFSLKDCYAIQEIHGEESLWRLLVNSLCPTVYGRELVKAGLLLSLVGGSVSGTGPNAKRPLIHVLVVGDPGLGKSHMLHSCSSVAPRGVYVCGNTTSSSGLTVTLTKESGGDFALEAGALVLANHGICCIDEFDKMTTQHQALLEAMEQERLSVAKGGVVCSLPAHTTIIAAANPVGGHYNKAKSLVENLRLSAPLLSRFDLIFILLDKPDEARAKVELREEATEADATDIVELMKATLADLYDDGHGRMDFRRSHNGAGLSQASRAKRFIAGLQRKAVFENKNIFSMDEMRELTHVLNLEVPDFLSFIATLNNQGFLLKKSSKTYKLLTV